MRVHQICRPTTCACAQVSLICPPVTGRRRKLGARAQVLGAKEPGERDDAEMAPALRLLAKVLLSMQQGACASLL